MANVRNGGFIRDSVTDALLVTSGAGASNTAVSGGIVDTASGTVVTPKYAFANVAAATTDGAVVAAVAGKKIRVLGVVFVAGATATTLTFTSKPAGAGSAKSCLFANAANGGASLPVNDQGWFETVAGEGLSATTGAGSTTGVQVVYIEV